MTFGQSISTCLSKYATFNGRATRSEFLWWTLFYNVLSFIGDATKGTGIDFVVSLVCLPSIAVGVRRMHDTNHSGWCSLIPFYNFYLCCIESDPNDNKYGFVDE